MPLIQGKSDKARSENIATEIRAGKPRAQAEAIGYSVQRKAEGAKDHRRARDAEMQKCLDRCNDEARAVAKDYKR